MRLKRIAWTNEFFICSFLSLAAFIITLVTLRNGVGANPDSWSYWEGSVGMIEKHRYCYLSGSPVVGWPPLFSLYLALFQWPLGQTGRTLALAMSVLSGLCAFTWSWYLLKLFEAEKNHRSHILRFAGLLFILFFVPYCSVNLFSDVLVLFFVGALFCQFSCVDQKNLFWSYFQGPSLLGVILCGCMLAHDSSLNFVGATLFAVWFVAGGSMRQRILGCCIICFLSLVPWLLVLHFMGEQSQHKLGRGDYTVYQYFRQVTINMGIFFISSSSIIIQCLVGCLFFLGAAFFVTRRPQTPTDARCRLCIALAFVTLAILFLMFNIIPVGNQLGGRFLFYFPLAIIPPLLFSLRKQTLTTSLAVLLVITVPAGRTCRSILRGAMPHLNEQIKEQPFEVIYSQYLLTSIKNPVVPPGTVPVMPPVFPWDKKIWTQSEINRIKVQLVEPNHSSEKKPSL